MSEKIYLDRFAEILFQPFVLLSEQERQKYEECCKIFDILFTKTEVTPEELDQITFEQLEWAMDATMSSPNIGEEHNQHEREALYEYFRAKELIHKLSSLPMVKTSKTPTFF